MPRFGSSYFVEWMKEILDLKTQNCTKYLLTCHEMKLPPRTCPELLKQFNDNYHHSLCIYDIYIYTYTYIYIYIYIYDICCVFTRSFHILISVHDVAAWSHIRQASDSARWMGFLSGAHGDTKISILSPGRRSCSVYQLLPTVVWIMKEMQDWFTSY